MIKWLSALINPLAAVYAKWCQARKCPLARITPIDV